MANDPRSGAAPRVAIYARFSSDMQSPRSSEDQIRECRAFAERMGWTVVDQLVERDDAVRAGAVAGREGYKRLVDAAKAGAYEILLVEETSRYSRDFWGGLTELAALRKYKVRLADTKIGAVDLDSALGQMQIAFGLVSSQQETTRLGERSKRGLKGKVLSKFSSGGVAPYGYIRNLIFSDAQVDVDGRPVRVGVRFDVHPTESLIVRRMFELYAAGASKHAIAAQLNREGVPTRGAGGTRNGRPNSGTWSTSTVKGILENEVYSGLRFWNKTSRRGEKHAMSGKKAQLGNVEKEWVRVDEYAPRIVESTIWEQVQRRLRADNESYKANHIVNNRRQYLLSGSMKCASCGAAFVIGVHRGKPPVPHYRCSFHAARGATVCPNSIVVSQPALERRLKDMMDVVVKDPKQLELLVAEHNRRISSANEGQLATSRTLEVRRRAAEEERERLVAAIALSRRSRI